MIKVFISHCSKDREIIEKLVSSINSLKNVEVFCSSYAYTDKLYSGADVYKIIRNEILSSNIVAFILSENFYKNESAVLEMGIAYAQLEEETLKPILFKKDEYTKNLRLIFNGNIKAISLDDLDSISQFLYDIATFEKRQITFAENQQLSEKIKKMSHEIKDSVDLNYVYNTKELNLLDLFSDEDEINKSDYMLINNVNEINLLNKLYNDCGIDLIYNKEHNMLKELNMIDIINLLNKINLCDMYIEFIKYGLDNNFDDDIIV